MSAIGLMKSMFRMMSMKLRGVEMIECREALERLMECLDGELDPETQARVAAHFEICRKCYPRYSWERRFLETLRATETGVRAPDELRLQILEVIAEEDPAAP